MTQICGGTMRRKYPAISGALTALLLLCACFRSTTDAWPEAALLGLGTPFVTGTMTGLVSNSIVLQNNGQDNVTVSSNGTFAFPTPPEIGSSYNVTILTQPADLTCFVQNGSGTFNGRLTDMVVTCPLARFGALTYQRCAVGQAWNALTGDCTGNGSTANNFGASLVQFCSITSNDCNSLVNGGPLTAGANGQTSTLFLACSNLNATSTHGINTWRVASKAELQTIEYCNTGTTAPDVNGDYNCNPGAAAPTVVAGYFPNTATSNVYSSATADGCCFNAYWVNSYSDGRVTRSSGNKTLPSFARCVSP